MPETGATSIACDANPLLLYGERRRPRLAQAGGISLRAPWPVPPVSRCNTARQSGARPR